MQERSELLLASFRGRRRYRPRVVRVDRVKGPQWFAKYRLPDGRQLKKRIGPAYTGRGRPPAGAVTKRTAQAWLDDVLRQADAGELAAQVCPDVTFADAAREWLRYVEHDRACKPSTLRSYRSSVEGRLVPAFGCRQLVLRREEGRGSLEQVALLPQARVLASQPRELVALIGCDAVVALAVVKLVLAAPVPERLRRHAEAFGELAGRAALTQKLNGLTPELRRVRRSGSGHVGHHPFAAGRRKPSRVHETGSTPLCAPRTRK